MDRLWHPMLITVTLNPALDKTLFVDRNPAYETVRATRRLDLAGGKGINAARALIALGARVRALAPLGGRPGEQVADLAREEGIEIVPVSVAGQTRTALTIQDAESGKYWHYLEPGPVFSAEEVARLRAAYLAELEQCDTVIISGSLPSPEAAELVIWMVSTAQERGRRVALDSFGAALRPARAGAVGRQAEPARVGADLRGEAGLPRGIPVSPGADARIRSGAPYPLPRRRWCHRDGGWGRLPGAPSEG
jgi:1-phosphofructokinase